MQHNIIYKVVNTITDEVYIGATTKSIEERKADHLQKSRKKVGSCFQESIATYGADTFKWEQMILRTQQMNLPKRKGNTSCNTIVKNKDTILILEEDSKK